MALNPNILLQNITPDLGAALAQGQELGQAIRNAPLMRQMNEAKLAEAEQLMAQRDAKLQQEQAQRAATSVYGLLGDTDITTLSNEQYQTVFDVLDEQGVNYSPEMRNFTPQTVEILSGLRDLGMQTSMSGSSQSRGRIIEGVDEEGNLAYFQDTPGGIQKIEEFTPPRQQIADIKYQEWLKKQQSGQDIELETEEKLYEIKLDNEPAVQQKIAEQKVIGAKRGEDIDALANLEATLPNFESLVNRLGALAETSTYTRTGRLTNAAFKELGFEVPKGADDRAAYEAIASNEVLPLLRQILGASFTAEEGKRVLALMGDIDASPTQKKAQLNAFITAKTNQIKMLERKLASGQEQETKLTKDEQAVMDEKARRLRELRSKQ